MVDFIYDLSNQIHNLVLHLPNQIENIEKLIHNYKIAITENDSLKKENEILKQKLKKYEKIPIVPCQVLTL